LPEKLLLETTLHARALNAVLVGLTFVVFGYHVLDVFWSLNSAMPHYIVHLGMVLVVVALKVALDGIRLASPRARGLFCALGYGSIGAAITATGYLYFNNASLEVSQPFLSSLQIAIGVLLVVVVFALNWFVWGAALTIVCLTAALYFGFGHLMPGLMADLAFDAGVIVSNLAGMGSPRGLFMYIPLSADTILLLLVYGGLMSRTKVLDMFAEFGKVIGNYLRGGVAFSCIAASSLIGMVTGQTVSCIALTGSMTIPTMVRGGFRKEEAGAIEVLAANGSQLIPPIMGLGAFLMAVITGIPYVEIAKAAILPAFLYVTTLVIGVGMAIHHFTDIGFSRQPVDWRRIVWILPSFVPSIATVIALLYMRYSASLAAFAGIAVLLVASFLRPREYRPSWGALVMGIRDGVISAAQLALILAAIGIIVQVLLTSGLGTAFSSFMLAVSGRSVEIALLVGMAIALIIGMGLPTPAAYSLCTIVMIPPLIDVGVQPLVAHFFGFYFAVLSAITPPVAVGILMAVRISGGSFSGTGIAAMKLCGVCLLLPYFIVAFPNALQFPNLSVETIFAAIVLFFATASLGAAAYGTLVGPLTPLVRAVLFSNMVLAMAYFKLKEPWMGAAAIAVFLLAITYRRVTSKRTVSLA
jgi:TRAP transporter 4TM/12TM fusion protein